MSRAIPFQDIIDASRQGIANAFRNYYRWSGGYWLGHAPESYMQVEIARALSKICPFVTLEDTVRDILTHSSAEKRGYQPRGNASGRVDIIVWWKNGTPRVLIEIKKGWGSDIINSDAKRLRQLSSRGGSPQHGIIIVYTDAKKEETIHKRFKNIEISSSTKIVDWLCPKKKIEDGEIWYWGTACFLVTP